MTSQIRPIRVVCMCQRGNCRSAGLAYYLKDRLDIDAVAIGWHSNGPDLQRFLFAWADAIIVMEPNMREKIPAAYHAKLMVCDVGPDRYGNSHNPELQKLCHEFVSKIPFFQRSP